MSIKPYISYTDRNTERSVSKLKVEAKNKSIIRKKLTLPTIVSLGTYVKKTGNANFFLPYIKNDTESDNANLYIDQANASFSIVNFNLSFLEESDLINNHENYYNNVLRTQIKPYVYGLDNKIGKFANTYQDFENQILNIIKDNISFIVPNENTIAFKVCLKNCNDTEIINNSKSIYNILNKEKQLKCERIFLNLVNLYCKIRDNENFLETLFNDIQKLTNETTLNV